MPAVIDIGSNTVQLIIGERAADGGTKVLLQTLRTTRLGLSDRPAHLAAERFGAIHAAMERHWGNFDRLLAFAQEQEGDA